MLILNTTSYWSWDIQCKEISFQSDGFNSKSSLKVIMEPAFPFFYVPPTLLTDYIEKAQQFNIFQDVEYLSDAIRFTKPCDQLNFQV